MSLIGNVAAYAAYGTMGLSAIWYASTMFFTVGQKQEGLVTAFGKHSRTEKEPGLHMKKPWPFNVVADKVYTGLQQVTEPLTTKTKDDLFVGIPITIQYEIEDTAKYFFDNDDPLDQMKKSVSAAVRNYASDKDFQELYNDRDEISLKVIEAVRQEVADYGIALKRIIVDEPEAPAVVKESYNKVRASERLRDAANNESEAEKIRIVRRAEAEKEAQVLHGEGVAGFREKIFANYETQIQHLVDKGISKEEALKVMMETMHMDVLRDIGHQGNMVIVTDGKAGGSANSIAELQTLKATVRDKDSHDVPVGGAPALPAGAPAAPSIM